CTNRPRNVGSVRVVVHGVTNSCDRIKPVRSCRTSNGCTSDRHSEIGWSRPHICSEVRMCVVDAGVHHGHQIVVRTGRDIPRTYCTNVRTRETWRKTKRLADILKPPELRKQHVVGCVHCASNEIRFCVEHISSRRELLYQRLSVHASRVEQI